MRACARAARRACALRARAQHNAAAASGRPQAARLARERDLVGRAAGRNEPTVGVRRLSRARASVHRRPAKRARRRRSCRPQARSRLWYVPVSATAGRFAVVVAGASARGPSRTAGGAAPRCAPCSHPEEAGHARRGHRLDAVHAGARVEHHVAGRRLDAPLAGPTTNSPPSYSSGSQRNSVHDRSVRTRPPVRSGSPRRHGCRRCWRRRRSG